ncbi:glycosyltransferase [Candidatus Villigracilis saccharophilus]|uniref:glycosyltransferase n=1 Tax=Candidatus Villigracilis saccharophilus TaxID=3140684 RepID=UPI003136FEE3|nr:glycosyltransferase [Anaerolineales bacterium]
MKYLHIIASLDPTAGGVVSAVRNLSLALQDLGHYCEIVTLDVPDLPFLNDFPGLVHALGPSQRGYYFNVRLIRWLIMNAKKFDLVIVNGVWLFPGLATLLASKISKFHYFVLIHGMLDPWFRIKYPWKHIKKMVYWNISEYWVVRNSTAIIYSNMEEKKVADKSFRLNQVKDAVANYCIIPRANDRVAQSRFFYELFPELKGKRLILFMSRIHPKKGCDLLIEAFAKAAKTSSDIHLVMAGPDNEGWKTNLIKRTEQLDVAKQITWTGMLEGSAKWGAFYAADVFILPSHSENFGIVVVEALSCGLPILMTDKVNIWREVVKDKAGFVEPDTLDGVSQLLRKWLFMSKKEKEKMKINALECYKNQFEPSATAKNFNKIIFDILNGGGTEIM